jgi:predicted ATPase/DNA-binding winged helix-turn-helix (wHTH) protein
MDIVFGDFRLRAHERDLIGPTGPVGLSAPAFELLHAFLAAPDMLLDKDALFAAAWPGLVVEDNTLQVHISALRKALGPGLVTTVHGRGYKYAGPRPHRAEPDGRAAPLQAAPGRQGNIGRFEVRLVEREAELAALGQLLKTERLVTVLGPGGVGKTTLALAAAAAAGRDGTTDVWVLDLAAMADGRFLDATLVQTLGVAFRSGSTSVELILEYLARRPSLLVFDNCEHVHEAVAAMIRAFLAAAPATSVLATSQVPLGLPAERIFRLKPFAADGDAPASAAFLADCLAVLGEDISPEERPALLRVGQRLDGVALALKMAAARAATMGIVAVDAELERQLGRLADQSGAVDSRFPSVTASLQWSYALLGPGEQRLFRALGVFMGSFSLDAARALGGPETDAAFAGLVQRSLVMRDTADRSRYRLLETSRAFALERLAEAGEARGVRTAHAQFMHALFARSLVDWEVEPDAAWAARIRPEADNLRSALAFAAEEGLHSLHVGLAASSYRFFMQQNLVPEGIAVCERAEAVADDVAPLALARLRVGFADIARYAALNVRGNAALDLALPVLRASDDTGTLTIALLVRVWNQTFAMTTIPPLLGELELAAARLPTCKTLAWALVAIGANRWRWGERKSGLARAEAGLAMFETFDNITGLFRAVINFGEVLHNGGDTAAAIALAERYMARIRRVDDPMWLGMIAGNVASYHLALGNTEAARMPFAEAWVNTPLRSGFWHVGLMSPAADIALAIDRPDVAALVIGFLDQYVDDSGEVLQPTEASQRLRVLARLSTLLPPAELERLVPEGRALSLFAVDHLVETTVLAGYLRQDGSRTAQQPKESPGLGL